MKLSSSFNALPLAVWVSDASGRYRGGNPRWLELVSDAKRFVGSSNPSHAAIIERISAVHSHAVEVEIEDEDEDKVEDEDEDEDEEDYEDEEDDESVIVIVADVLRSVVSSCDLCRCVDEFRRHAVLQTGFRIEVQLLASFTERPVFTVWTIEAKFHAEFDTFQGFVCVITDVSAYGNEIERSRVKMRAQQRTANVEAEVIERTRAAQREERTKESGELARELAAFMASGWRLKDFRRAQFVKADRTSAVESHDVPPLHSNSECNSNSNSDADADMSGSDVDDMSRRRARRLQYSHRKSRTKITQSREKKSLLDVSSSSASLSPESSSNDNRMAHRANAEITGTVQSESSRTHMKNPHSLLLSSSSSSSSSSPSSSSDESGLMPPISTVQKDDAIRLGVHTQWMQPHNKWVYRSLEEALSLRIADAARCAAFREAIHDNFMTGVIFVDTHMRVRYANAEACNWVAKTEPNMFGVTVFDMLPGEDAAAAIRKLFHSMFKAAVVKSRANKSSASSALSALSASSRSSRSSISSMSCESDDEARNESNDELGEGPGRRVRITRRGGRRRIRRFNVTGGRRWVDMRFDIKPKLLPRRPVHAFFVPVVDPFTHRFFGVAAVVYSLLEEENEEAELIRMALKRKEMQHHSRPNDNMDTIASAVSESASVLAYAYQERAGTQGSSEALAQVLRYRHKQRRGEGASELERALEFDMDDPFLTCTFNRNGDIQDCNDTLCKVLGTSRSMIVGTNFFNSLSPESHMKLLRCVRMMELSAQLDSKPVRVDMRTLITQITVGDMHDLDSSLLWVRWHMTNIFSRGRGLMYLATGIVSLHAAEGLKQVRIMQQFLEPFHGSRYDRSHDRNVRRQKRMRRALMQSGGASNSRSSNRSNSISNSNNCRDSDSDSDSNSDSDRDGHDGGDDNTAAAKPVGFSDSGKFVVWTRYVRGDWLEDAPPSSGERHTVDVSACPVTMLGYKRAEFEKGNGASGALLMRTLVVVDDRDKWSQQLSVAIRGVPNEFEYRMLDKSGAEHWLFRKHEPLTVSAYKRDPLRFRRLNADALASAADDDVFAVRVIVQDITRGKLRMLDLEMRNKMLELIGSGVCMARQRDGTIVYCNSRFAQAFGYPNSSQLIGQHMMTIMQNQPADPDQRRGKPLSRHELYLDISKSIQTLKPWRRELLLINKLTGEEFWAAWHITPFMHDTHRDSWLLAQEDITSKKLAIKAIRKAKVAAELSEKAKSSFLACMSHEIRTPMNGVIGMAQLLWDTDLSEDQKEFVDSIQNSGDHLLHIINDILDFSKIESEKLELEDLPFQLHLCIEQAVELVGVKKKFPHLNVIYHFEPGVPVFIYGDVTRLRQILVNLVGNAGKFTASGGVQVTAKVAQSHLDIRTREFMLQISVRDTGIGIPPEKQSRLFKAFSQVDASTTRQYGGTGLGLAISYKLAKLMGGSMWVESIPGQGTSFCFTMRTRLLPKGKVKTSPSLTLATDGAVRQNLVALRTQGYGEVPLGRLVAHTRIANIESAERKIESDSDSASAYEPASASSLVPSLAPSVAPSSAPSSASESVSSSPMTSPFLASGRRTLSMKLTRSQSDMCDSDSSQTLSLSSGMSSGLGGSHFPESESFAALSLLTAFTVQPLKPLLGKHILVVDQCTVATDSLARMLFLWGLHVRVCHTPREAIEMLANERRPDAISSPWSVDMALVASHFQSPPGNGIVAVDETDRMDGAALAREIKVLAGHDVSIGVMLENNLYVGDDDYDDNDDDSDDDNDGKDAMTKFVDSNRSEFVAVFSKPLSLSNVLDSLHTAFLKTGKTVPKIRKKRTKLSALFAKQYPLRLLMADDNLTNQRLIKHVLTKLGYADVPLEELSKGSTTPSVTVVDNGKIAVDAVKMHHFDVIFMDMMMPVMGGLEATRIITHMPIESLHHSLCNLSEQSDETQRILRPTIIAMTASALPDDRKRCMDAGMQDYISKPVSFQKIQDRLSVWGSAKNGIGRAMKPELYTVRDDEVAAYREKDQDSAIDKNERQISTLLKVETGGGRKEYTLPKGKGKGKGKSKGKGKGKGKVQSLKAMMAARRSKRGRSGGARAAKGEFAKDNPLRILVAEDNMINQKLIKRVLERLGYVEKNVRLLKDGDAIPSVSLAVNGKLAYEAVQQHHFDLVFMDMEMPIMGGIESTQKIRAIPLQDLRHPACKIAHLSPDLQMVLRPTIVAMTANANATDRKRCMEAGMDDFLTKPLNIAKMKALLLQWSTLKSKSVSVSVAGNATAAAATMSENSIASD